MISFVPLYPFSCKLEKMMYSAEAMHDRFLFGNIHMRDEYPASMVRSAAKISYSGDWLADTRSCSIF